MVAKDTQHAYMLENWFFFQILIAFNRTKNIKNEPFLF